MFEKPILLMDGKNYFDRMYFSVDNRKDNYFEEILNRFISFQEKREKKQILFAFDTTKSQRRLELFSAYKVGRDSHLTPEQKEHRFKGYMAFVNVIKHSGYKCLDGNGYEADDYIACASELLKRRNNVIIISTDQDFYQLICQTVSVYDPTNQTKIDFSNVKYLLEVPKEFHLDYKCIIGDKSDKIPGVGGVGKVTAKELIEKYGDLQSIINGLSNEAHRSKKEQKILDNVDILNRNRKLMSLRIPINDKALQTLVCTIVNTEAKCNKEELMKALGMVNAGNMYRKVLKSFDVR